MTQKGFISKVIAYKRYYIISSLVGDNVILFFEELSGDKFFNGDLIEYDIVESKEFGKCALNPLKIGNVYFDELKIALDKYSIIEGYVYEKNEGGYLVSYNGYKCFLPNIESAYKDLLPAEDFINTYQFFNVISIENDSVILTRKSILKEDRQKIKVSEIADFEKGFTYIGKVKSVEGFGVFVCYKYSEGLLHISNILNTSIVGLTKKEKSRIQMILSKVFTKGREVIVSVDRINDTQFSVIWDKNVEPNKEICIELNLQGLST